MWFSREKAEEWRRANAKSSAAVQLSESGPWSDLQRNPAAGIQHPQKATNSKVLILEKIPVRETFFMISIATHIATHTLEDFLQVSLV